jgi:polynucleotide 5'-kinase involved in rRNA processing
MIMINTSKKHIIHRFPPKDFLHLPSREREREREDRKKTWEESFKMKVKEKEEKKYISYSRFKSKIETFSKLMG